MTKSNSTKLPRGSYEAIIAKHNAKATEQSGFIRVEGATGRRLYVASTKTVGRIDLSGFEFATGTKRPDQGEFGRVKQQMDLVGTEEELLARFEAILVHMLSLPAEVKEPKAKAPKAPKAKVAKTEGEVPAVDPKAERLAAIQKTKEIAAQMGYPVSQKTLAEEADLLLAVGVQA